MTTHLVGFDGEAGAQAPRPEFTSYYGVRSFNKLLEEAQARGQLVPNSTSVPAVTSFAISRMRGGTPRCTAVPESASNRESMATIQHLLVPTDGSENALKAAAYAGDLARALDARVTDHGPGGDHPAPCVGRGRPDRRALRFDVGREIEPCSRHAREHELARTTEALGTVSNTPELVHRWGHAAEEICRYAIDHAVDLIVMGSHGRSGFKRMLLGSISNAVANHAHCPVTIVR